MIPSNLQTAAAVRALIAVFEAGPVNSIQVQALAKVRVALGDIKGAPCTHGRDPDGLYRSATYGEHDRLICDLCGAEVGG